MYYKGLGVPQDYKEAVKWYNKAAEQGHTYAQSRLGLMYDNGQGVPQDYKEAVKWYTKAAEQGNAAAQCNLGVKYDNGQGVLQDAVQAYAWSNVASTEGIENATKIRDLLLEKMTPAQIAEAQKLSKQLYDKIYGGQ